MSFTFPSQDSLQVKKNSLQHWTNYKKGVFDQSQIAVLRLIPTESQPWYFYFAKIMSKLQVWTSCQLQSASMCKAFMLKTMYITNVPLTCCYTRPALDLRKIVQKKLSCIAYHFQVNFSTNTYLNLLTLFFKASYSISHHIVHTYT